MDHQKFMDKLSAVVGKIPREKQRDIEDIFDEIREE